MATEREREILRLIEDNPLISQQELATQCGITRSSVAVHISNLMKKGLIRGKGYIVQKGPYAAVVGGANMDIGGHPVAQVVLRDSNPGRTSFSPGGVGRNIAHNLALLGESVKFISVFGDDQNGAQLRESCLSLGIDLTDAPVLPGEASAVYLFITNHQGEMELAVSGMDIYEQMTPQFLQGRLPAINKAAVCVVDTNPPAESLRFLLESCTVPVFADPVSTTKAKKLAGLFPHIHTLKCNRMEAELFSGSDIRSDEALEKAATSLVKQGLAQVVVTLGEQGCLCADGSGVFRLPAFPATVKNTTGAGDAFTAALAHGFMRGYSLRKAALEGLAAASLCIADSATICREISAARVQALASGSPAKP